MATMADHIVVSNRRMLCNHLQAEALTNEQR